MSFDQPDTRYTRFVGQLADNLALAPLETDGLIRSLRDAPQCAPTDPLDYTELLLAVSLNAQIRNAHNDARFKKLKFLLRNNNDRAVNLASQWVDQKMSFEAMLSEL